MTLKECRNIYSTVMNQIDYVRNHKGEYNPQRNNLSWKIFFCYHFTDTDKSEVTMEAKKEGKDYVVYFNEKYCMTFGGRVSKGSNSIRMDDPYEVMDELYKIFD